MKSKILSLLLLTTILLSLVTISATITVTAPKLSQTGDSVVVTITSDENETIDFGSISDIVQDGKKINFTTIDPNPVILNGGITIPDVQTITINYVIQDGFDFDIEEDYSTILTGTRDSDDTTIPTTLTFEKDFCSIDNPGGLDISNLEFDVLEGYGDDEDFWYPMDEIELSFDVENTGDYDMDNIEIEICVLDTQDNKCVFDEDDFDLSDDDFNLDFDDDEVTITASLILDINKLKAGNTDYEVHVKAQGDIDDSNAPDDIDGDPSCSSVSQEIEIRTNDDFIIFSDFEFSSEPTLCGEEVTLDFKVWNIGDKDLDNDEVYIWVHNKDLNLDEEITFRNGIDKLEEEMVSISFRIPEGVDEKFYGIIIAAYDDNSFSTNDLFENKEGDESEIEIPMEVKGNCELRLTAPKITAELDSETPDAIAGEQVIIKATVKNNGEEDTDYTISIMGNSAWSSLVDITPKTITVAAGESETVDITLNIDEEAEGDYEFTIKATYGEKQQTTEQKVALTVVSKGGAGAGITGATIGTHLRDNAFIYAIVIINLILIIAIISVVRRMASGPQITA